MAQISSITLPNSATYDLKGSIHTVIGTQTAATSAWTGNLQSIDALYDGLTIAYWLPYDYTGSDNVTLNLTLKNNSTGNISCYYRGNTPLTTECKAGDMVLLTYWSQGTVTINNVANDNARWVCVQNYSDDNEVLIAANISTATDNTKIWIEI